MKRKAFFALGIVCALLLAIFVGSGFTKNGSVFVEEYTVSPDGETMTLRVGVSSSMGYVRSLRVHQKQGGKLYLDGYHAFGGWNGSIGARETFSVPLDTDTRMIALYRSENGYEEVLTKAEDGTWHRTGDP